ncbi:HAMP domain-containing protein [Acetobacterium malicum]|uniref:HAMP domain-containing protein n=1 Tax=Acetobacterium malicum TaxID=52692 RepID=A0ABR6Z093_9FIRM|nr:methyl-accepting chemotaxis protein [Acetobacterium malicum]MBC3900865.1 HAMP domain-containing protein [Acetobacterium malicum]
MKSIRTKLMVYFSGLILVICTIFTVVSINALTNAVVTEAEKSLETQAQNSAEIISSRNEQNYIYLEGIASRDKIFSSNVPINEKMAMLKNDVSSSDRFLRIGVSDLNGNLYLSDSYGDRGQIVDITKRDYFHDSAAGERGTMNPVISVNPDDNGALIMAYSVPIYENGTITGVLVAVANAWFLNDITDTMNFGETGYTYIIDSTGTAISHPDRDNVVNQMNPVTLAETDANYKDLGASIGSALEQDSFTTTYTLDNQEYYMASAKVAGMDWTVVLAINADEVLAALPGAILSSVLISIVVLAISIIFCYFIAKRITDPIKKVNYMIKEMGLGHLSARLNMETNDEIGEMAVAMDNFADNLQTEVIEVMNQISDGDVSADIEIIDDQDEIKPALKKTIESIRGLIDEATMLAQAGVAGQLSTRGDSEAFKGGFKDIVVGVNDTLDAVVGPLNVAADYVDRIGKGQIPEKITATYNGDFNTLKNSINACIDGLSALEESNRVLGKMSLNDYSETMPTNYLGIYAEIGHSINDVHTRLTRIVEISTNIANGDLCDLEILSKIGKRSANDTLIPALVGMIQNIINLVDETEKMASIAIEGNLSNRGDVSGFPGEYGKIVTGFNQTLDAVIAPIEEASATLTQLSQGNLHTKMAGDYRGDHAQIKEALNRTIGFLSQYVAEITSTLEEMGRGNLNQEISTDYLGDFQAIKTALNDINTNLSHTMTDIDVAAAQVEVGARQISDGGQALAQGTTEQASSIQELTASIEEVAGETKKNAMRANEANERAIEVRTNAEVGNTQMTKMISAMSDINMSSNDISKIIKVIDDIAFQTNILALNAAVEAARAGQHGKGFAVVAEEVRSLAARSAEAAKETTGLIEGSIDKVNMGTKIADETAISLKEILDEIEKVTSLVGDIAQASNEQASEIAQITQGIEQVSQVVQTNSATAEESAAASEELSGQAEMLKEMVGAFKVKTATQSVFKAAAVSKPEPPAAKSTAEPRILLDDMEMDKY